jgi:hypothetical protein
MVEDRGTKPVGAADSEGELGRSLVAPRREPRGEHAARPQRTVLVKRHQASSGRQGFENQLRFACL